MPLLPLPIAAVAAIGLHNCRPTGPSRGRGSARWPASVGSSPWVHPDPVAAAELATVCLVVFVGVRSRWLAVRVGSGKQRFVAKVQPTTAPPEITTASWQPATVQRTPDIDEFSTGYQSIDKRFDMHEDHRQLVSSRQAIG